MIINWYKNSIIKKIVILGTGGNCIDILDTINVINSIDPCYECVGFLDDNPAVRNLEFYGVKVLGPLSMASELKDVFFVNGIGSPNNFWKKEMIIQSLGIANERFETLIHPSASVSAMSEIGFGTVIFQNVTVCSNVKLGNHIVVLPNSVISHDDVIGDYTCIAGGVCVSGGVVVEESCYLGSKSSIIGNISIGKNSMIGMGSNVLKSVESNSVMYGNPAKMVRKLIESL